jgi:D-alanine-D-alanine ligase
VPKLRVGLVYGGVSTEHEVSVTSATTIWRALDPARYAPVLIALDHDGAWYVAEPESDLLPEGVFQSRAARRSFPALRDTLDFLSESDGARGGPLDVIFPIVHGRGGEDGALQGLCELAGMPYVGCGVAATALCMDKRLARAVLRNGGLPVVPDFAARAPALERDVGSVAREVEECFGLPVFVKPANSGSSVGVSKAKTVGGLELALKEAARYDVEVLAEPALDAREIECAVLGGHRAEASVLGEIRYPGEFYDYAAKYASDETELVIPAPLPAELAERLRELARSAFTVLGCWGMARVDFFVDRKSGDPVINELNTLPGFTDASMYPKLWEATGVPLPALVDRLIELALERHRERRRLLTRFSS